MVEAERKEDDYDFPKEGREKTVERLQKDVARLKSMVQYPEARDQYCRLLNVVSEMQETKVGLEMWTSILNMVYQVVSDCSGISQFVSPSITLFTPTSKKEIRIHRLDIIEGIQSQ
ncbi:UNVERIFIED_CONTAM: Calmodulin-binding transcription activator 3 [Sesamum calycinum]|uniref:Calmodulin-binding transcription activator 3 n=1 Tax=Sesamum calycinum TaxID=2727403 RepID=A0AAW2PA84_9LAMI